MRNGRVTVAAAGTAPSVRHRCPQTERQACHHRHPSVSPEARLALTRAVARPGSRARFLTSDEDGRKVAQEWTSIRKAVRADRPFMVEVAANRLAVDADTDDAIEALGLFAQEVRHVGITPVLVESGRGRHLFASVRALERPMWEWRAVQRGLDARNLIRPPCAPHPLGLQVRILGMTISDAAEALSGPTTGGRRLSPRVERLLAGDGIEKGSRSELVQTIATAAYAADWTSHEFSTLMRRSPTWRGFLDDHGPDALDRAWAKARNRVMAQRSKDRDDVTAIMNAVDDLFWTGAAGRTDRQVLAAHLNVAFQRGTARHCLSIADAAIASGVSRRTIPNSRDRLIRRGVLRCRSQGSGMEASVWTVQQPGSNAQRCAPDLTPPGSQENRCASLRAWWDDPGADAYRWRGLGKVALEVFAVLDAADDPLTAPRIADACPSAPHPATVRRVLRKAHESNLIEGAPHDGWRLVPMPTGLAAAAEVAGTAGSRAAAIEARNRERARRARERYLFASGASGGWIDETAPYLPVPGDRTKMLDPATGEILERPDGRTNECEPVPDAAETSIPTNLRQHLGYAVSQRSA